MTILNIGSINWDRVLPVDHIPAPGETIAAGPVRLALGGKGLNHSVAAMRAGADVFHVGAVGQGDGAILDRISNLGLSVRDIVIVEDHETGSAQIMVDANGENAIVLAAGANRAIPIEHIENAIGGLIAGQDRVLLQNETNGLPESLAIARLHGAATAVAAAPFVPETICPLLPQIDLPAVNAIEFAQLCKALGGESELPPRACLFITRGAKGIEFRTEKQTFVVSAPAAKVVDTTGAGDTAFGSFLGRLDQGSSPQAALEYAAMAASLQVSRHGAAEAIPSLGEVQAGLRRVMVK